MNVAYVGFNEVTLKAGTFMTSLTWIVTNWLEEEKYVSKHYFTDYPSAKDSERLLADAVGGQALVRYSLPTVLRAFKDSLTDDVIIVVESAAKKNRLKKYAADANIDLGTVVTVSDLSMPTGDIVDIQRKFEEARADAAKRFGNSL